MRRLRYVPAILLLAMVLALAGCDKNASVAGILQANGVTAKTIAQMKVQLRYLKESKGADYKISDISGNGNALSTLLQSLDDSKAAAKPQDKQFFPEQQSDCEIVFADGKGNSFSLLYGIKNNLLIYPVHEKTKKGDSIQYVYFTPGSQLGSLIQNEAQTAQLERDDTVKPFMSVSEMKASIDPDDLAEAGADVDFEFFSGTVPASSSTTSQIYTSDNSADLPKGSYLITAYGKSQKGEQIKLSIQAITANTNYTKVLVDEPDSALDSLDTGDTPDSFAVTVNAAELDRSKWLVFVDSANNILSIIMPQDIPFVAAVSPAPGASKPPQGPDSTGAGNGQADGGTEGAD